MSTRALNPRGAYPLANSLRPDIAMAIVADYAAGASTYELANKYEIRRNTARDLLRKAGIDTASKAKSRALGEPEIAELRRLWRDGLSRKHLAEVFNVSESTIHRAIATQRHRDSG